MTKYIAILILLSLCSCASIKNVVREFDKEGEVTKETITKYSRIGDQKIGMLDVTMNKEGITGIYLEGQEASAGELGTAINNLMEAIKNLSEKGMGIP